MSEASYNFLMSVPFLMGAIAFGIAGLVTHFTRKRV